MSLGEQAVGRQPPGSIIKELDQSGVRLRAPLGAMLFFLGAGPWAHGHPVWLGCALGFCAGTFLCIACADLLPELQFHRHDRGKLSLALLAGMSVVLLIVWFGHAGHDHHQKALRDKATSRGSATAELVEASVHNAGHPRAVLVCAT